MTAKGNEVSPAKMPLMRIRSVEIVFEDEMSTCTDTGILDRSIELLVSDSSDDSTKCVDDLEQKDNYDVTLNADGDLSEDNSISLKNEDVIPPQLQEIQTESLTLPHSCNVNLSPNASEIGDSGRFTEDASTSHFENVCKSYDDALLSHSHDVIDVDNTSVAMSSLGIVECTKDSEVPPRFLFEYIGSNSEDSDDTATCDGSPIKNLNQSPVPDDHTVDGFDQYDSFIDMGKF